jgi:hypothetical protein
MRRGVEEWVSVVLWWSGALEMWRGEVHWVGRGFQRRGARCAMRCREEVSGEEIESLVVMMEEGDKEYVFVRKGKE